MPIPDQSLESCECRLEGADKKDFLMFLLTYSALDTGRETQCRIPIFFINGCYLILSRDAKLPCIVAQQASEAVGTHLIKGPSFDKN